MKNNLNIDYIINNLEKMEREKANKKSVTQKVAEKMKNRKAIHPK